MDEETIVCNNVMEIKNDWFIYKKILKSEDLGQICLKFKQILSLPVKEECCNFLVSRKDVTEDSQGFIIIDFFKGRKIKILIKFDQINGKSIFAAFIKENKMGQLENENCFNIIKKYLKI